MEWVGKWNYVGGGGGLKIGTKACVRRAEPNFSCRFELRASRCFGAYRNSGELSCLHCNSLTSCRSSSTLPAKSTKFRGKFLSRACSNNY